MNAPRIFADFQNADVQGRVRLNCVGTQEDLLLADGMAQYSEEEAMWVVVAGVVEYSEEKCWVAVIDWDAIKHMPVGTDGRDGVTSAPALSSRGSI